MGYLYTVLGYYEGFEKDLKPECQVDILFDTWESMWDIYDVIVDYNAKYPDLTIKIVQKSEVDNDGSRGKMPAFNEHQWSYCCVFCFGVLIMMRSCYFFEYYMIIA